MNSLLGGEGGSQVDEMIIAQWIVQEGVGLRVRMRKVQCTMNLKSRTSVDRVEKMTGLVYGLSWQTSVFIYIRIVSLLCVTCFLLINFVAVVSN